ncbi:MAG: NAD-dependent epimerase/dehydratase family protein [Nitrospina sp.]|nr:MAG: NAD-dependent epimerase/dehydratase family protein [Nitrospina sp.]
MYAVTGVTGTTGAIVARRLLQQEEKVRVVLRDRSHIYKWKERGAEPVIADFTDPEAMAFVLDGIEGAYLICPPSYQSPDPMGTSKLIGESLVTAVSNSQVPHVVFLSSQGARRSKNNGIMAACHEVEQKFRQAGFGVTLLRSAYFMENWVIGLSNAQENGSFPTFIQPADRDIPMVSVEDVGQVAVDCLLNPVGGVRVVEICGPREYSAQDVAAILSEAYQKPVTPHPMPRQEWEYYFSVEGLSWKMAELLAQMFDDLNKTPVPCSENQVECRKGTITLEQALRKLAP